MAMLSAAQQQSKLDSAITLLNNHMPSFGTKPTEASQLGGADTFMAETPDDLAGALTSACIAAAKYVEKSFAEDA